MNTLFYTNDTIFRKYYLQLHMNIYKIMYKECMYIYIFTKQGPKPKCKNKLNSSKSLKRENPTSKYVPGKCLLKRKGPIFFAKKKISFDVCI